MNNSVYSLQIKDTPYKATSVRGCMFNNQGSWPNIHSLLSLLRYSTRIDTTIKI